MHKQLPYALLSLILSGCFSQQGIDSDGNLVSRNFGYTRVVQPLIKDERVNAISITTYGLNIENGLTLGYKKQAVVKTALDCGVVFIVQNTQQIDHLLKEIPDIKARGNLCITKSLD